MNNSETLLLHLIWKSKSPRSVLITSRIMIISSHEGHASKQTEGLFESERRQWKRNCARKRATAEVKGALGNFSFRGFLFQTTARYVFSFSVRTLGNIDAHRWVKTLKALLLSYRVFKGVELHVGVSLEFRFRFIKTFIFERRTTSREKVIKKENRYTF